MEKYFENNTNSQLIHVTSKLAYIISMLEEQGLRLGYCGEQFSINYRKKPVSKKVHPMVSFTEQDKTNLFDSEITYGKYGIAFDPIWIIKNNIQPVMYVEQNSPVADSLAKLLRHRRGLSKGHVLRSPIMTTACFVKNTIGFNSHGNHGKGMHDFLFKQENEWRYVPRKDQIGGGYISEDQSKYESNTKFYKDKILEHPLEFNRDEDIVCVYYENDSDEKEILDQFPQLENKVKKAPWKYTDLS